MNKLFVGIVFVIIAICAEGNAEGRKRFSFNENWQFAKGDYKNAPKVSFDDSGWRTLTVPHDWAIEGPFDEQHNARTGGLPVYGTAWYRKQFTVDKEYQGKKVTIEFDGVMDKSQVYVNGHLAGGRPFGYIGFELDITPYINYGEEKGTKILVN